MANIIYDFFPVHDIVCSLLDKPFSTWEESDQIDIVKFGRPLVTISTIKRKANDDGKRQFFRKSLYFRYAWTCGSTYFQNIHCWPCLLFAKECERWNCGAYFDDIDDEIFDDHARQESHITSFLKLEEFKKLKCKKEVDRCKIVLEDTAKKIPLSEAQISRYAVHLNRKCAQLAVDTVMFMVKKQMPLKQEDESNVCSYADLFHLQLFQSHNDELKNHFRKMKGSVNPILANSMVQAVVESVSECILEYIQAAVKEAEFFSLRIDDGLDESSECALFIRIVTPNNELKEFFIGSYSLGRNKNSLSLFEILDGVLEKYEYKSKLIGICFDNTCVKFNYLKELYVGMKFMAQQCTNVNLFGHSLDYTVEKCLRRIPACRQFFANLSALFNLAKILVKRNCYQNSEDWREVCNIKNSCCSKLKLLSTMLQDWRGMLRFFQEIQQETVGLENVPCISFGTPRKLKDHQFIFLAVFLRDIFEITNTLYQELIDNPFKPIFCQDRVKQACATLYTNRNDTYYGELYKQADQIMRECSGAEDSATSSEDVACYKPLFYEILDNIIMELHTRFENTDQHTYFEIGNLYRCNANNKFVKDIVKSVKSCFPNIFKETEELENDLIIITYARKYENLPLLNAIYCLRSTKQNFLTQVYRLMTVITLQTPSTEKFPCLHEFSSYLKDSDIGLRPHLSNILMNEDNLNEKNFESYIKDNVLNKLSVKYDAIKLSYSEKSLEKRPQIILGNEPRLVMESESNLLMATETPTDMTVEVDPANFISSVPGPSNLMEQGSFMMDQDVHSAITSEVYPAEEHQSDSLTKIKEEPVDPDTYKQDILSDSVIQELRHFSKEHSSTSNQDGSLFQPPVLIKEEPVSFEEEL